MVAVAFFRVHTQNYYARKADRVVLIYPGAKRSVAFDYPSSGF